MINVYTTAKIEVATKLCNAKDNVLGVRSYICLNEKDNEKIDIILDNIDSIVNRVMGAGK